MAILFCGDTHGMYDLDKVLHYFGAHRGQYSRDDYLIILGDAGILWDGEQRDRQVQEALESLPVTTLWLDGNHENFTLLAEYPEERWHGGRVQFISESILHLLRGQVFELNGLRLFTFGGGVSTDRKYRQRGVSWWPEEMPTDDEYAEGLRNLEKVGFRVDYILSHTCPAGVADRLSKHNKPGEEVLRQYLEAIAAATAFKGWYFGHWHMDKTVGKFHCLYNEITEA